MSYHGMGSTAQAGSRTSRGQRVPDCRGLDPALRSILEQNRPVGQVYADWTTGELRRAFDEVFHRACYDDAAAKARAAQLLLLMSCMFVRAGGVGTVYDREPLDDRVYSLFEATATIERICAHVHFGMRSRPQAIPYAGFGIDPGGSQAVADRRQFWQLWRTPRTGGDQGWVWAGWLWANPCEALRVKEMEDLCQWPLAVRSQNSVFYSKTDLAVECRGFAKGSG